MQTPSDLEEAKRLRRCMNDLVSLNALPAVWAFAEPAQIARSLVDVLVNMLDLAWVCIQLNTGEERPLELSRSGEKAAALSRAPLSAELKQWFGPDPASWPARTHRSIAGVACSVVLMPLGVRGALGWLAAVSERSDFAQPMETLLLNSALNHAVVALQNAWLLGEQTRLARELDRRVEQRTAELATANELLRSEIDERKRAEEAANKARNELAHVARVTTLNVLAASIAHEVNQPLTAIITNANTSVRMLNAEPPNVDGARRVITRTIRDGNRASEIITRLRAMFSKETARSVDLDLNALASEVIALASADLQRNQVVLRTVFAPDLPGLRADRVQLQQVILNLLLNASDAMSRVEDRERLAVLATTRSGPGEVSLSVRDVGHGLGGRDPEHVFQAFFTTKETGMGIGLSISRSIIEGHNGRLWAAPNDGPGATFTFSIPVGDS